MGRLLGGIAAGIVVAWLTLTATQFLVVSRVPPPEWLNLGAPGALQAYLVTMPVAAMAAIIGGCLLAALLGGLAAGWIARARWIVAAAVIGLLLALGLVAMRSMLPLPGWMLGAGIVACIPAALAGAWLAGRLARRPAA